MNKHAPPQARNATLPPARRKSKPPPPKRYFLAQDAHDQALRDLLVGPVH